MVTIVDRAGLRSAEAGGPLPPGGGKAGLLVSRNASARSWDIPELLLAVTRAPEAPTTRRPTPPPPNSNPRPGAARRGADRSTEPKPAVVPPDGRSVDALIVAGDPVVPIEPNAIKGRRDAEALSGTSPDVRMQR
ncbi:MAG: hypothetical protein JWP52_4621 [Rhizobacter sp.]|nr:hypothetical protein [Rhizobacter sp.]